MENTDKYPLRFYIALFSSVFSHSILFLFLFFYAPSLELKRKTIPFQLISSDNAGQISNKSSMSQSENALAAQEFLRTLNESTFEKLIRDNTQKSTKKSPSNSETKQSFQDENPFIEQPIFKQNNNASNALQGIQNIFSRKTNQHATQNRTQQISTQSLEELNEYEIKLLQKLAKDGKYDVFYPIMKKNKQDKISFTITLQLFPNGAIKNAQIRNSSNTEEIDKLAISLAFYASPYPKPPKEDINIGFKYNIPIIYDK